MLTSEIREALREGGEEEAKEYYQEVLLIVYRLLFLLYAEQRGMMASRESLYTEEYAVTNLREKAETRRSTKDDNTDLWHGLQITFRLVEEGNDELDVPCYDGMLFDSERLDWIAESECPNDALLDAIEDLTLIEYEGTRQRISYADLGVEEIGSVYESLLEFTPRLATEVTELEDRTVSRGEFYLDDRGTERKETGSYYTDPGLVQELVQSALKPVVEDRLEDETTVAEKEDALLDISVCDPASGSGAFLIAANNFLAQRLARIRSDSDYPPEEQIREARRDVLQHCIYAVDLNPMAVELAKVSLWINSAVEDKPLNFLDHHIKCGNSLIGTNSELLEGEFPVDAYETSGGRDWHVGNEIRKRVRNENKERSKDSSESSLQQWGAGKEEYVDIAERLDEIDEEDTEDIEKKRELYNELQQSEAYQQEKLAYDIWIAAFYWPMDGSTNEYPSPSTIEKVRRNPNPNDGALQDLIERATKIAEQQRFFHWELEFPEIFYNSESGFDCVLGNPPWDKIKPEEKQWFAGKNEKIATTDAKRSRSRLINELEDTDEDLYTKWENYRKSISSTSEFIRSSGRYPLSGSGELNTYPIFTELAGVDILDPKGRMGMVVKTGVATDKGNADFFSYLIENNRIDSLFDFENTEGIFADVEKNERFCLLTLVGSQISVDKVRFSFFNKNVEMVRDSERRYYLSPDEIIRINPNTKTCPTFRNTLVKNIAIEMYTGLPVLINESENSNPWGITYHRLFDMTLDSELFEDNTLETLKQDYNLNELNHFVGEDDEYLPFFEGKLFNQFDHRFGSFDGVDKENRFGTKAETRKLLAEEKKDPHVETLPRYWLNKEEFDQELDNIGWEQDWIFAFRNVARSHTDFRTSVGTIIPCYPCGNSAPVLTFDDPSVEKAMVFTSLFTSFAFDFTLRQSIGGANLNLYILKQLPMPSPETIKNTTLEKEGERINSWDYLYERSVKLTWTSHSLDALGQETNFEGPFIWDDEERRQHRAEIDAAIAKIYGLSSSEFEFILNEFRVLKDKESDEFGEFRSKKNCLREFDKLSTIE